MTLRKGKTKTLLQNAIESSLMAVETYNSPRANFRVETYITLMTIAWTRLFHAYFYNTIGDKYYYREPNGRFKIIDGEKRTWELKTCIKEYGKLSESQKANLEFFIKIRNKIEHHYIDKNEIGVVIFGECQSLLYNFENTLISLFGDEYSINESLAFSLQFSRVKTKEQLSAGKKALSSEIIELKTFIETFRTSLSDDVFNSQEYSIKLLQIPKVASSSRNDLSIEFVNWKDLSDEEKVNVERLVALIKDKTVKQEAINPGKLPVREVKKRINVKYSDFNDYDNQCLLYIFDVKPDKGKDPFDTNTKYCHYDEPHHDYIYQEAWPEFIIHILDNQLITKDEYRRLFRNRKKVDIKKYEKT